MDDNIANFIAITSAEPERAAQYLRLTDNNLEQAVQLFYDSPNLDLGNASPSQAVPSTSHPPPLSSAPTNRARPPVNHNEDLIHIDSDDDMSDFDAGSEYPTTTPPTAAPSSHPPNDALYEDDEAMARRIQEELYAGGDSSGAAGDVRAPMARTTETLVGPGATWGSDPEDLNALVAEQIAARNRRPAGNYSLPENLSSVLIFYIQDDQGFLINDRSSLLYGITIATTQMLAAAIYLWQPLAPRKLHKSQIC